MPNIKSSELRINQPIEAPAPDSILTITIDAARPLKTGSYVFQLEVLDDSGNRSKADKWKVVILDNQLPTAIIKGPDTVPFNTQFTLSGSNSSDQGGGSIARYIWTLVEGG